MMTTTKDLLTSLTSSEEFCTLCLTQVDENAPDTEDVVCLNIEMECFVRYSEMIATMLHQEEQDCTVTRRICRNCARTTIVSYKFIKMCKESRKALTNTVDMLSHCFFDVPSYKEKYAKSIYVAADTRNNKYTKFYDKISKGSTIQKPFERFKQLLKSHNNKTAVTMDKDDFEDDHTVDNNDSADDLLEENETSCHMCSKTFSNPRIYRQHLARVHGPKVYQCKKCSKSYSKPHYLNDHMNTTHALAVCKLCDRSFGGFYRLKRHMFTHKNLMCPNCGREYENWVHYRHHVKDKECINSEETINLSPHFVCKVCKHSFAEKLFFQDHMLSHTSAGNMLKTKMDDTMDDTDLDDNPSGEPTCRICSKIFANASSLKRHNNQFHRPPMYKREQRPKKRDPEDIQRQHKIDGDRENWVCHVCGKSFATSKYLADHLLRHNNITYKCNKCGKEFKNRLYYTRHVRTQHCTKAKEMKLNQERPICDVCKKSFGSKSTLREHIRFEHENGRHFMCDWCGRRFPNPSTYKAHIVKHTRERNFICKTCNGKFVTKAALTYHNRLHTGERPFKCHYCDMSFLSASRRMAHIRRHHMDPMYECNICGRKFIFKTNLDYHTKKHSNPQSKLYVPDREIIES